MRPAPPRPAGFWSPGPSARRFPATGCRPPGAWPLSARGPTGTVYWRDPDKQRSAVRDGWCRAGDFVTLDEDGYVWFLSREDALIKSSGYRMGPEEIEEALAKHAAVADVGVIGVADTVRGQNTRAYVVLKPGVTASEALRQELVEFCRDKIAVYKLPREIEFVETLPPPAGPAGPGPGY